MERTAATLVTLAASVASAQQAPPNPTFFLDASQQVGAAVKDSVAGVEFGTLATAAAGAVKYWDLESATLTRSGGAMLTEGQAYTHAFWLQWTPKRGYRTLFHHSLNSPADPAHKGDHCQFTQQNELGVRSNRSPAKPGEKNAAGPEFNACTASGVCYNVTASTTWEFVVAVGNGVSTTSPAGNTTFYVGGAATPANVGTAARTCCGMSFDRVGWPGAGCVSMPKLMDFATKMMTFMLLLMDVGPGNSASNQGPGTANCNTKF